MTKTYTERGKGWEWLHSWWMLFVFVPFGFTSFISFLYVGARVKNKKWALYSMLYLGAMVFVFSTSSGAAPVVALGTWVFSIFHAFSIRPIFLIQLDVIKEKEKDHITKVRQEARERFAQRPQLQRSNQTQVKKSSLQGTEAEQKQKHREGVNQPKFPQKKQTSASPVNAPPPIPALEQGMGGRIVQEAEKIDLNKATEAEIGSIPALGLILAKRIVAVREEIGGFESFEQFVEMIGLKDHTVEKVKDRIDILPRGEKRPVPKGSSGRLIDY